MLLHALRENLVVRVKTTFALQIVQKLRSLNQPPLKVVRTSAGDQPGLIRVEAQRVFIHCDIVQ